MYIIIFFFSNSCQIQVNVIKYGFNNNVWDIVIIIYGGAGGNIDVKSSPGMTDLEYKQTKLNHAKLANSEAEA